MVGKGATKPGKPGTKDAKKGKHEHPHTPGLPQPPLIITNEQLVHKNWWPVIGLVVENSPVESLLVDLMVDCVEGNSVITLKKDDLIQEALNLLKTSSKSVLPDEGLSRRETEKRAKRLAEAEQQRERERLEKEREERMMDNAAGEGKPSNKLSKTQTGTGKKPTESLQGQSAPPVAVQAAQIISRAHCLSDDLFDELKFFNQDKPLEEILKSPTVHTLVLLIKYKLIQLKRYDRTVFDAVRKVREPYVDSDSKQVPETNHKESKSPVPTKTNKGKEQKPPPGKDAKQTAPVTVSLLKPGKPPGGLGAGKNKGLAEEETNDPPQLAEDENIQEPAYIECLGGGLVTHRAQAKDLPIIPLSIATLFEERLPKDDLGSLEAASVKSLMGDVTAGRGTTVTSENADRPEDIQPEVDRIKGLFLASILGTDGLPPLNHALTTKLGTYGLPAFSTSRNQMVRYIILQGFTEGAMLEEMTRRNAPITCLFKIQLLRQRNALPLQLRSLLWVRNPQEQTNNLQKFWSVVGSSCDVLKPTDTIAELCPLALQVKFDVTEHTTRQEFQVMAKETSSKLASLFFQVVKAKTLFQFYNNSLKLQSVPTFQPNRHMAQGDRSDPRDVFDFVADLSERGPRLRLPSSAAVDVPIREDDVPLVQMDVLPVIVQDFVKNLEMMLYRRGVLPCLTPRQRIMSPLVDSRHNLQQKPRAHEQIAALLGYLGAENQFLSTRKLNSTETTLKKALRRQEVKYVYHRQRILLLLHEIGDVVRKNTVEFVKEEQHVNNLAAAMSAWRTSTKIKKHPQPQEEVHEFQIPHESFDIEAKNTSSAVSNARLERLIKMQKYFAVIKYTSKQLISQLSIADNHFFHHTVRWDPVSSKIILIFHALHEKNSHTFVRRSITRLHSRADFPTFVCNIMENVQTWADENLNRTYRCPRRTQISPQFPYGCQGQFAYQRNCAALLSSPSADHFQGFIRKYSLKNLVQNNRDLFARRCNWMNRKSLTAAVQPDSTRPSPPIPSPPRNRKAQFIWNRAKDPLPPRCTVASTHRMTAAYSLSNVLTKIVRHEERIYCRNCVVAVDTSESYNEKTAVHITASFSHGMEIFLNCDEHSRTLSLELENGTRLCLDREPTGARISLLDSRKVQVKLTNDSVVLCDMVLPIKADDALIQVKKPTVLSFARSGHIHRILPDGAVETISPSGTRLKTPAPISATAASTEFIPQQPPPSASASKPTSAPISTTKLGATSKHPPVITAPVDLHPLPPPPSVPRTDEAQERLTERSQKSHFHMESPNVATFVGQSGLQTCFQKMPDGFLRRVQVSPELRITTRKVNSTAAEDILIEQPNLPRVGMNTATKVNYIACQDGVLLVRNERMYCLMVAGISVVVMTPDGMLFAGNLGLFCDLFGIKGLTRQGLQGFATTEFVATVTVLFEKTEENVSWQQNDSLFKCALTGDILCSVQDLAGLQHDIHQNGEIVHQKWEDERDRCVMPNPRVFVIDPITHSGSKYLFSHEAIDLKYKIIHFYATDHVELEPPIAERSSLFVCKISDEPRNRDWRYSETDVLPASMLSDLKGLTNYRPSDGPVPKGRRFDVARQNSAQQLEHWRTVTFVAERPYLQT